ncbi:MAG: ABC transporter substrate-binding protein [Bdellovibrionales bacterium]|nr:ABC transporter substrate-binding protein [Bdellovibrionales bacterium]
MKKTIISFLSKFYCFVFLVITNPYLAFADDNLKELKIGSVLYLTNNDYANVAQEFKRGLELAAKDTKIPVKLIFEDDMGRNSMTVSSVEKLVAVNDVDVVFFAEYVQMRVGIGVTRRRGIPAISIWESSPEIEDLGEYAFGFGLWSPNGGAVPAEYAFNKLNAKRAAVIHDETAWSNNIAKYFKQKFTELGGEINFEDSYNKGTVDFRASIAKLNGKDFDILFAPIGEQPVPFFKQLRQVGFSKPVLSSDQISKEFIDAADGALEGVMFSNADDRLSDKLNNLALRYVDIYEIQPHNIYFVGLAYEALSVVAKAWENKGEKKLNKSILEIQNYPGLFGPISISDSGTYARPEVMYLVKNGKQVHLDSK